MKQQNRSAFATLAFYASHPGWHSFQSAHKPTMRAIARLSARGFLQVSTETKQARFTGKVFE